MKKTIRYILLFFFTGTVFAVTRRTVFPAKRYYFCSQFVAELLLNSGAFSLKRPPALYLPNHFCRELASNDQLLAVRYNPV